MSAAVQQRQSLLDAFEARLDAVKRKCNTGYGCGRTCISVQKECQKEAGSAISKERISRLQQLARGEIKPKGIGVIKPGDAAAKAAQLTQARDGKAAELRSGRQQAQAAKAKAAAKAKGPRADVKPVSQDDDYAFARKSAVGNAGEDLANSARHKRNAFRTIEEAEASGQAEKLITRDNLLKNFPVDLITGIDPTNCLSRLESHYCLKAFPGLAAKAVTDYIEGERLRQLRGGSRRYLDREIEAVDEKTLRKQYFDAFQSVRDFVEANKDMPAGEMRSALAKRMSDLIGRYRKTEGQGYQRTYGDPYNPVANALVDMQKRLTKRGSTSVYGQMDKFAKVLAADVGADWRQNPAKSMGRAAEAATKIMEGSTLAAAFGKEGSGKKRFSAADLYVAPARRVGGRSVGGSIEAATDQIIKRSGFRGLQYGNSVTDDERKHHVQKAAEAMVDLADILELPDEAISLKGTLGLAIGARGKGTAMAHYEPGMKVINLTRKKGIGTLAHEWGHALDNFAAGGRSFLTENVGSPEKRAAMFKVIGSWETTGFTQQVYRKIRELKRQGLMISDQYWLSREEMFARSFEAYCQLKLAKAGRENSYLTQATGSLLWPTREQSEAMEPAFDALMAQIRQDDFPGGTRRDSREERVRRFVYWLS